MDLSGSAVLQEVGVLFQSGEPPTITIIEKKDSSLAFHFTADIMRPVAAQLEKFLPPEWQCRVASTSLVVPKLYNAGTPFALLPPGTATVPPGKVVEKVIPGMHLIVLGPATQPVWQVVVAEPAEENMQKVIAALSYEQVCADLSLRDSMERDRIVLERVAAKLQAILDCHPRMTGEEALAIHVKANWPAIQEAVRNIGKPQRSDDSPAPQIKPESTPEPAKPDLQEIAAARHWVKLIGVAMRQDNEDGMFIPKQNPTARAYGWAQLACRVLQLNYAELLLEVSAELEAAKNTP